MCLLGAQNHSDFAKENSAFNAANPETRQINSMQIA